MKFTLFLIVLLSILLLFILKYGIAPPAPLTERTCEDTFGDYCGYLSSLDDALLGCNGTQHPISDTASYVEDVKVNQSVFFPNSGINATCYFREGIFTNNSMYIWYYDGKNWYKMHYETRKNSKDDKVWNNVTISFKLNSTLGMHIVRCIIAGGLINAHPSVNGECSNSSYLDDSTYWDTDDVNFTVTDHLKYDSWGLNISDCENLTRSDVVLAYAHWNKELSYAYLAHNGTDSLKSYAINPPFYGNWTNYTLNLSNTTEFPYFGLIWVNHIFAKDTFQLINSTSPSHYFYLWRSLKLDQIISNDTFVYNNSPVKVECRVVDYHTNEPIRDYNVTLFEDGNPIETIKTNSLGWATFYVNVTANEIPKNVTLKCNITDRPDIFYKASSINSKNETVQVINLGVYPSVNSSYVNYGDVVEITANITGNASAIIDVYANITYTNISDSGELVKEQQTLNLNLSNTFSDTNHEYKLVYTPPNSGEYNVTVIVHAGKEKWNTTSFHVSFGTPKINSVSPNYRVMINQTFYFAVNVSSVGGDLWYTNFSINITNETVMNITGNSYSIPILYNISKDHPVIVEWNMKSKNLGLTSIRVDAIPQNGSSESDFISQEVVSPILTADNVFVNQNTSLKTKIIGNVTPIKSVNLTVFVPYTGEVFNLTSVFVKSDTEYSCTGESIGGGRLTLGKDYGGSATCTPMDECLKTIDNDTLNSDMTLGGEVKNLTIKLNSEQTVERIFIRWKRVLSGNFTIYYNRSGSWVTLPQLSNLSPPSTDFTYTNITGFSPFVTNAFLMENVTSNAVADIEEFEAYSVPKRVGLCYIYEYNFSAPRSGTYEFYSKTKTSENATVKQNSSFYVEYGYPLISIDADSTMFMGSTYDYNIIITAYNGDLRNLTVNLTIYNTTVLRNSTPEETFVKNVSEILDGESKKLTWNLTAVESGSTDTQVFVNNTTNEGHYNQSEIFKINVTATAGDPPNVANFWFSYGGVTNKTNLFTPLKIYANVSDDVKVEAVIANLTYPGGENVNLTMTGTKTSGWQIWEYTFENTEHPLNETGNYTVGIIVRDLGGQENTSGTYENYPAYLKFSVFNTYNLSFSTYDPAILMRGESVSVQAIDVNGNIVEDVNWTINITKFNETFTNTTSATTFTYTIKPDDPEVNYSIVANASKYGNSGIGEWKFNVSSKLSIILGYIKPSPIPPGSLLNLEFQLKDARGSDYYYDTLGYITCLNESYMKETFPLYFTSGYAYDSLDCYAHPKSSTTFDITVNASEETLNVSGTNTFYFTTKASEAAPSSPGGSPSIGSTAPPPTCTPEADYENNCTDEKDNDCDGATDCADADCFDFPACIKRIPNFNFTLSQNEIEIVQGENGTVIGSITNLGNVNLNLKPNVTIEKNCCSVYIQPEFYLKEKATLDFPILLHVYTFTQPGDYVVEVKMRYGYLENLRSIKVKVKKNKLISSILEDLVNQLPKLNESVNELKAVGIDVTYLENKINDIKEIINKTRLAVQQDKFGIVKSYYDRANSDVAFINSEKSKLEFKKLLYENKWNILLITILGAVSAYLIGYILVPFLKISTEITKLTFEKNSLLHSRKAAQVQYFMRKIDEQTFRRIVEEKQSQILKVRSSISLKKKERIELVKRRLNPLSLIRIINQKLRK